MSSISRFGVVRKVGAVAALAVLLVMAARVLSGGAGLPSGEPESPPGLYGREPTQSVEDSDEPILAPQRSVLEPNGDSLEGRPPAQPAPLAASPWRPTRQEVVEMLPGAFVLKPEQRESTLSRKFGPPFGPNELEKAQRLLNAELSLSDCQRLLDIAHPFDQDLRAIGGLYCDELDFAHRDVYARGAYQHYESEPGAEPPEYTGSNVIMYPGHYIVYSVTTDEYPALSTLMEQAKQVKALRLKAMKESLGP